MRENIVQSENNSWRKHWFVVNVLVEIPVIGSFFKKKDLAKALHAAAKCTAMLAGGTTAMMTILVPTEDDSTPVIIEKMATSMAIGMTTGKVLFNVAHTSCELLYHYAFKRAITTANTLGSQESVELDPLNCVRQDELSVLEHNI